MKNSQPTRRRFAEVCLQGVLGSGAIASAAPPPDPAPAAGTIFRSDVSQASPAPTLTREFQEGRRQLLDYGFPVRESFHDG
jgi:hypothetical protein